MKFSKYISLVILITVFITSCRKNEVIVESECTSDCFEISGIITNASTNTPEAFRKIQVQTTTNVFPYVHVNRGYVLTKADGTYIIRIAKTSLSDKEHINFLLTLEDKPGYLNDYHFNQYFLGNLKIDSTYTKNISVYQSTNLKVILNNDSPTDSFFVGSIDFRDLNSRYSVTINKNMYAGEKDSVDVKAIFGHLTKLELLYMHLNSPNVYFQNDSIICTSSNNNEIILNIR